MNIVGQGRIRMSTWLGAVFVAVCVFGAGQVEAHKMPKSEICHFKKRKGIFKKISVSGRAARKHIRRHGDSHPGEFNPVHMVTLDDDCNIVDNPPLVLARAFTELKDVPNGIYDPNQDISIAALVDADGSGDVSDGDTVTLGDYPLQFEPDGNNMGDFGTFTLSNHTVVVVLLDDPGLLISVTLDSGAIIRWEIGGGFEQYAEELGSTGVQLLDNMGQQFVSDLILVREEFASSQPDTDVFPPITQPDSLDSSFLQIRHYQPAN